jgi:LmbE family N-acetylglucosaminyl deacetylase
MAAAKVNMDPQGTVILSPHSDDAALSLGGVLCRKIIECPTSLITIFGRTNYLQRSAFQADHESVTTLRKFEDLSFAKSVGVNLHYLDFPEAGLRYGPSFEKVFADKIQTDDCIPSNLPLVIQQIIERENPKYIYIPLGIGLHRDHLIVNRLSRMIAPHDIPFCIYYEDLPYAGYLSEGQILKHVNALHSRAEPIYVPIDNVITEKLEKLSLYRSQIRDVDQAIVRFHANRWEKDRYYERVWTTSPVDLKDMIGVAA